MLIPDALCLLLERLFGTKPKYGRPLPPNFSERVEIYLQAVRYVEEDLRLFAYVLGHRRIVSPLGSCPVIDDRLIECMCRDPRIIPSDYKKRLPKYSVIVRYAERLYMRDKEYKRIEPEPCLQLAAE